MGVPKLSGGDFVDTNQVGALGFSHYPLAPQINDLAKSPLEVITAPSCKDDVEAGQALQEVEAAPEPPLLSALAASVCMGLIFGGVMDLAKVTLPIVIREQFIFQRFIMLKMFLGAAGFSALVFAILSKVAPQRFEIARGMSADCVRNKGLMAEVVGR